MKTTVVPAQVTTVEDRIAGNFTFTQIVLFIIPLITSMAIYVLMPVKMHVSIFKTILVLSQFIFFGGLAIRFRGRIMADWLVIYLRFKLRPRIYIFSKNDLASRDIELHTPDKAMTEKKEKKRKIIHVYNAPDLAEQSKADQLLENPGLSISFKLPKKGGIDVAIQPIDQ